MDKAKGNDKPQFIRKNGKIIPIGGKKKDKSPKPKKKKLSATAKKKKAKEKVSKSLRRHNAGNAAIGAGIGTFFGGLRETRLGKKSFKFDKKTAAFAAFGTAFTTTFGDPKTRALRKRRKELSK